MSTDERIIQGLVRRRGKDAARAYAQQTLRVYRRALLNPRHFASTPPYRRAFVMSYQFYKHYLNTHVIPPGISGKPPNERRAPSTGDVKARTVEECERLIDAELAGSFPASDPPSWTLGGSLASQRRRH